jgi:hypothetical protein
MREKPATPIINKLNQPASQAATITLFINWLQTSRYGLGQWRPWCDTCHDWAALTTTPDPDERPDRCESCGDLIDSDRLYQTYIPIDELMAGFFGYSEQALNAEREAVIDWIRADEDL